MSICNIVDYRTNKYNVRCDAVFEPSWNDNCIKGATKFSSHRVDNKSICEGIYYSTIRLVMDLAHTRPITTTVYLYDYGSEPLGIRKIRMTEEEEYNEKEER